MRTQDNAAQPAGTNDVSLGGLGEMCSLPNFDTNNPAVETAELFRVQFVNLANTSFPVSYNEKNLVARALQ
jgi:hypothetical protein